MLENRPGPGDRVAYLGRASSAKQKIEHQREEVVNYCERTGIHLPPENWFEDKVKRHKQLDSGVNFKRLMDKCLNGDFDWIIIATFDRWGIESKDDIFVLRKQLNNIGVRLYVVSDDLEITGSDDSSFWRVAARAEGATSYVGQMSQKNIQKMHSMAHQGLATTGNSPYAIDLVCYPLINSSPDLSRPLYRVVRELFVNPAQFRIIHSDGAVEVVDKMPLRDKRTSVYRYEKSLDPHRLKAIQLIFEYVDSGMTFGEVAEALWKLGYSHYRNIPFKASSIEAIVNNPAYIGKPAFGKNGTGTYYQSNGNQAVKVQKKAGDKQYTKKPKDQYVLPDECIWADGPIVDPELFERVQQRLANRTKSTGKRTRSKILHPLNGKVICPECNAPMGLHATVRRNGETVKYYICQTYRNTRRKQCHANSFRTSKVDNAIIELLATVKDRVEKLTDSRLVATLQKEEWAASSELGKLMCQIVQQQLGKLSLYPLISEGEAISAVQEPQQTTLATQLWQMALVYYQARFVKEGEQARERLIIIDAELDRITQAIMDGIPSQTVKDKLNQRMHALEHEKAKLQSTLVPLTAKAETLQARLHAIKRTIEQNQEMDIARLLDSFLERVEVVFEGDYKVGCERPISFRFVPRAGNPVMGEAMVLQSSPEGCVSSRTYPFNRRPQSQG